MHVLFKDRLSVSQRKGGEKQMDGKYVARLARPKLKGSYTLTNSNLFSKIFLKVFETVFIHLNYSDPYTKDFVSSAPMFNHTKFLSF